VLTHWRWVAPRLDPAHEPHLGGTPRHHSHAPGPERVEHRRSAVATLPPRRRMAESTAARDASGRHSTSSARSSSALDASRVALSRSVRPGLVVGMPSTRAMSARSSADRWTLASRGLALEPGGTVTCGKRGGSMRPKRAAAVRCEQTAPPAPREAAIADCCHVTGAAVNLYSPRMTRTITPARARFSSWWCVQPSLSACSVVMRPRCRAANRATRASVDGGIMATKSCQGV
jgi:hypothetical protein